MSAPVSSTLVATANIGRTESGGARVNALFDKLTIGQHLKLQVIRQLENLRYEVAFGGRRHVVESRVTLQTGTQVEARVESKGDQLELRYLATDARAADEELAESESSLAAPDADAPIPPWLNDLAEQYRVPLDARSAEIIGRSAAQVANPLLMTRGGLFLQKLSQPPAPRDLDALYRALGASDAALSGAVAQAAIENADAASLAEAFETASRHAADAADSDLTAGSGTGDDPRDDTQRAQRLLNLQDEGGVAWRYGTLPLLVGGRLIELDVVLFREREQRAARGGLKRLVMTLDTTHFGRVQVEARAVDSRIIVKLRAPTADAVEMMSAYGADVRAAIEQLGWSVDEVAYEIADGGRAAQAVVDHVLSSGSVDREL
jgi:hypothetical protein